ncbi:MAG TPA: phosphatase PAP2 family protein [Anaerolineales bacterium]
MPEQAGEKSAAKVEEVAHAAAHAATAPPHVRRYRAVLFQLSLLIITAGFAVLTFLVKMTPSFPIDLQITRGIQQISFPLFYELMVVLSWPGFGPQSLIITALIVLMIYGFGLHWEAVMALIAAVFSTAVNVLVKDLIQRPRPTTAVVHVLDTLNSYSFPSGHVMFYLGFFGFIWFLAFSLLKPSWKRGLLLVFFGGLVVLIGISRIYVGEHWASDVLGSYLLGTLTLVVIIQSYRWGKTRFFIRQPVAAAAAE